MTYLTSLLMQVILVHLHLSEWIPHEPPTLPVGAMDLLEFLCLQVQGNKVMAQIDLYVATKDNTFGPAGVCNAISCDQLSHLPCDSGKVLL